MSDAHKMALVLSLLERGIPMEVAALTAGVVHPFAELGRWTPDRQSEKAARKIAKEVARAIGRGTPSLSHTKERTKWALEQYAALAPPGSEARSLFEQAANREALR